MEIILFKMHEKTNRIYRIDIVNSGTRLDRYYYGHKGLGDDIRIGYRVNQEGIISQERITS